MTWSTFHRRCDVLRAVIASAENRRDGVLPTDVTGVDEAFDDARDLVGALQLTWYTRLMGAIERCQLDDPTSSVDAVVTAWQLVAGELAGVRLVLDAARESDVEDVRVAMARATDKERRTLARAAGLGASAAAGSRLEARARETVLPSLVDASDDALAGVTSGPARASAAVVWDRMVGRLKSLAA